MLQMIRYNMTGEVRVIDTERMIASEFLHAGDRNAPLSSYELDCELSESDLEDYTLILNNA